MFKDFYAFEVRGGSELLEKMAKTVIFFLQKFFRYI